MLSCQQSFMPGSTDPIPPPAEFIAHVTRAQRMLHSFILTMVWNAADADDVLQETNLVLWRKAAEFDPSREFVPWAMRCAQLQTLAYLKRRQRSKLVFDDGLLDQLAAESIAEAREIDPRRAAMAACLEKLPVEHRRLLAGRYEPAGSVNSLAAARGTTPKALSELLRRIRHTLLRCIERTLAREARA